MKYLTTVNELGNYITKRLAFLLKEKPVYTTNFVTDKSNKYHKVRKHTNAYLNRSNLSIEFDYQFRTVRIEHYDIINIYIELDFYSIGFYTTEYIDPIIDNLARLIPAL